VLDHQSGKNDDAPDRPNSRAPGNLWSTQRPDIEQGNEILRILEEGERESAIGIGSIVGYMRDGVSAREMFGGQRIAARCGRQTSLHLRNSPGTAPEEANGAQE